MNYVSFYITTILVMGGPLAFYASSTTWKVVSGNWSSSSSWSNKVPTTSNDPILSESVGSTITSTLDQTFSIGALIFNTSSADHVTLNSSAGSVLQYSTGPGDLSFQGSGTYTVQCPIQSSVVLTIQLLSPLTYSPTISGNISGGMEVDISSQVGTGVPLYLGGTNTYTGSTTIESNTAVWVTSNGGLSAVSPITLYGTLYINDSVTSTISSLQGNGLVSLGPNSQALSTLQIQNGNGYTYSGAIVGHGDVVIQGGTLTLSGANTYAGALSVQPSATLLVANTQALSSNAECEVDGILNLNGYSSTVYDLRSANTTGIVQLLHGEELTITTGSTISFAGTITGSGIIAIGTGKQASQILSGNLTYTGGTAIHSSGQLSVIQPPSTGNIANNGTFVWSPSANSSTTYSSSISGSGFVHMNGGPASLIWSGAMSYSGGTQVDSGITLQFASSQAVPPVGTINNNGLLVFSFPDTLAYPASITGSGAVTIDQGSTLEFSGKNSYAGTTTINTGATLQALAAQVFSPSSLHQVNGILNCNGYNQTLTTMDGNGTINMTNAETLTLSNGANATFTGTLSGNGSFQLNGGTFTFSGVPSYSGTTHIASGATLIYSGVAPFGGGISNSGALQLGNATTISQAISGTGIVTCFGGSATLTSSSNTYSGSTTINSGATCVAGNTNALSPNSIYTVNGTLNLNGFSNTVYALSSAGNGTINMVSGETLTLSQGNQATFGGSIQGNGSIYLKGSTLTLTGTNSYTGSMELAVGTTLNLNSVGALPPESIVSTSGTVNWNASIPFTGSISNNGTLNLYGPLTFTGSIVNPISGGLLTCNNSLSVEGSISGSQIVNINTGTTQWSASSSYQGNTVIAPPATLQVMGTNVLSPNSAYQVNGVLNLNGFSNQILALGYSTSTTGLVSMSHGETLTILNSKSWLFPGSIQGNGSLMIAGGTQQLSGQNSYTGGTTISNTATLQISAPGALPSSGGVINHGMLTCTLPTGATLTIAAPISGEGGITINQGSVNCVGSAATITVSSSAGVHVSNSSSGSITELIGSFDSSETIPSIYAPVTLDAGSLLTGNWAFISSVIVNGGIDTATVAPGSSPGVITVNDAIFSGGNSILQIFVDATTSSQLQVLNHLTVLPEAECSLQFAPNTFFSSQRSYDFLSYGDLQGIFSRVVTKSLLLAGEVVYGEHHATLHLQYRPFQQFITGHNAASVATALYRLVVASEDIPLLRNLFPHLISLSAEQISSVLNELQPAALKGFTIVQENNGVRVQEALATRWQDVLDETHCTASPCSCCPTSHPLWTIWADGWGDFLDQKSHHFAGSPQVGYDATTGGVVGGIDRLFGDHGYLGLLGAYSTSHLAFDQQQGSGSIDTGYAGLYLSWLGKPWYLTSALIGSWSHFDVSRKLLLPWEGLTAQNSHGGAGLLMHLDTGLNWGRHGWSCRPFDSIDLLTQSEGSFSEAGAGVYDLHVQSSSSTFLRNELGMQLARCHCWKKVRWILSPKLSWVREVRLHGAHLTSRFVNTSIPFTVTGDFPNRSLIAPGLKLTASGEGWAFDLIYNGEWATHHYNNQNIGLQARVAF